MISLASPSHFFLLFLICLDMSSINYEGICFRSGPLDCYTAQVYNKNSKAFKHFILATNDCLLNGSFSCLQPTSDNRLPVFCFTLLALPQHHPQPITTTCLLPSLSVLMAIVTCGVIALLESDKASCENGKSFYLATRGAGV